MLFCLMSLCLFSSDRLFLVDPFPYPITVPLPLVLRRNTMRRRALKFMHMYAPIYVVPGPLAGPAARPSRSRRRDGGYRRPQQPISIK